MTKYVYVIASSDNGPVKIGVSNNPQKRLKTLQTGHPLELFLKHVEETSEAFKIETILHNEYSIKGIRGEWFDMTVKAAIDYLKFTLIDNDIVEWYDFDEELKKLDKSMKNTNNINRSGNTIEKN